MDTEKRTGSISHLKCLISMRLWLNMAFAALRLKIKEEKAW